MLANNGSFLSNIPPVVRNLLIINILCWFAQITLANKIDLSYYCGMHYWGSDMFNPAQMLSYMFLHSTQSFMHLLFNMFGLYMFGKILEQVLGSRKFLTYYLICGLGAAIVQQLMWSIDLIPLVSQVNAELSRGGAVELLAQKDLYLNQFITIGASGSIFGLLLAFGMLFPNQPMYLIFLPMVPIKAKYFVIGYALIELVFGVGNFSFDNIAHFAHLGGMLFGFFVILYWKKKGI